MTNRKFNIRKSAIAAVLALSVTLALASPVLAQDAPTCSSFTIADNDPPPPPPPPRPHSVAAVRG